MKVLNMFGMTRLVLASLVLLVSSALSTAQDKFEWEDDDLPFTNSFSKWSEKSPAFNLYGGTSMLSRYKVDTKIEDDLTFGLELGMGRTKDSYEEKSIARRDFSGLFLFYHNAPEPSQGNLASEVWRFGFASETSYGYRFSEGNSGIYLGAGLSPFTWGIVNVQPTNAPDEDRDEMLRLDGALRFGESMNADVDFRFVEPVSLVVRYDWTQIYPRHMFWYWGLSLMIEGVSSGLLSTFISAIGKSSPEALPIMNFILQNGIAMGFKALRMNKMNWPFDTEAPLNVMTYSVGVNLHF